METARLRLDPWTEEHTGFLVALSARPEVTRYIATGTTWTPARAEEVAARGRAHCAEHGWGWRAATERATGTLIGLIALNRAGEGTPGVGPDEHEIGWWLAPEAWGRGYAREGAAAVRDDAFARGAPGLVARIQPGNAASLAVAGAIGMAYAFSTVGRYDDAIEVLRVGSPT